MVYFTVKLQISLFILISFLELVLCATQWPLLNGKFTKAIKDYRFSVPQRINSLGEFESFYLPSFFNYDVDARRKKRSPEDSDTIRYSVRLDNEDYHLNLWPNHDFLVPTTSFETYDSTADPAKRKIRGINEKKLCYFRGKVKGFKDSSVALSTCNGLTGIVKFNNKAYYVEPVEGHTANPEGHHLHIIHKPTTYDQTTEKIKDSKQNVYCPLTTEDWREGWKNAFKDQLIKEREKRGNKIYEYSHYERNISQFNIKLKHAELMIVGDKKFMQGYTTIDIDEFLLTCMNLVNNAYHDYTVGAPFEVYLKRVILLEKEEAETEIKISTDATNYLFSFCKWVEKLRGNEDDPNHFDTAVILTGVDICAPSQTGGSACSVVGRAEIARFCVKEHSCLIAEARGLISATIIAHEMGHLLGCDHDGLPGSMCANDRDEVRNDTTPYIMAGTAGPYPYSWSPCSRAFIRNFLATGIPTCLENEPEKIKYEYKNILPGIIYDMDQQCLWNMAKYNASKFCPAMTSNDKLCAEFFCKLDSKPSQCVSWKRGAMDGTKCGENKWCIERKCVPKGSRGKAINGGWGDWSGWTECSRTCGGGIRIMERQCDKPIPSNGGMFCVGDKKKFEICNKEPCKDRLSFRAQQCQKVGPNFLPCAIPGYVPCWLHCYDIKAPKPQCKDKSKGVEIIDGTPCKGGTKNRCIEGVCIAIGCDWKINSGKEEDVCGVCGGDGASCKLVQGENDGKSNGIGRWLLVKVPQGSRKIEIWASKMEPKNSIAVSDGSEKNFYLHPNRTQGYYLLADEGEKQFGADIGYLTYRPGEKIHVEGPTLEDLVFFINYNAEKVTYKYRYASKDADSSYIPSYHWDVTEFSECSVKCGGGVRSPVLKCIEAKAGVVADDLCKEVEKPKTEPDKCNNHACKIEWRVGTWSKCEGCRFKTGTMRREVECVQENSDPEKGDVILLEDDKCEPPKPGHRQLCVSNVECKERKRDTDEFLDEAMEDVWQQIHKKSIRKRQMLRN